MASNKKPDFTFHGKYIINAELLLLTGMHIGGSTEGFEIGGLDNPVIKDPISDVPYIPGSSLKGKMRSLLEWAYGLVTIKQNEKTSLWEGELCSDAEKDLAIVFGVPAEEHPKASLPPGPTRLTVRDAYPKGFEAGSDTVGEQVTKWERDMGEGIYTEIKYENAIDRLTSVANPRPMERVPAGSRFELQFIYDVYQNKDIARLKLLFEGLRLLEDSALGGGGSRGSGRIKVESISVGARERSYYLGEKTQDEKKLTLECPKDGVGLEEILKNFSTHFPSGAGD